MLTIKLSIMKKLAFILASLLIITSCSVSENVVSNKLLQKRKYTKGFHLNKNNRYKESFELAKEHHDTDLNNEESNEKYVENSINSNDNLEQTKPNISKSNYSGKPDEEALTASTTDYIPSQSYPISKNNFQEYAKKNNLHQKNELFKQKTKKAEKNAMKESKKVHWAALTGFVTSLVGLLFMPILLGIIGIVFSSIGLVQIKKSPELYKGKGFAIAGLVVGIVDVLIMFLLVAVLLAAAVAVI